MDTTANTFTKRNNAKRAAEAMIAKGTAPALDYGIKQIDNPGHSDDGRFEIVWKTGNAATAVSEADIASAEQNWSGPGLTTDEIETEIAEATAEADADPFARIRAREEIEALGTTPEQYGFQPIVRPAHAATEPVTADAAPEPAPEAEAAPEPAAAPTEPETAEAAPAAAAEDDAASPPAPSAGEDASTDSEAEPDPFPVGAYVHVQMGRLRIRAGHITQRVGQANRRVHLLGAAEGVTLLVGLAQLYRVEEKPMPPEEPKPARQSRRGRTPAAPQGSRSRYGIDPDLIAAGRLPDKAPVVTSAANQIYQKQFDKLFELATAGDWDKVRNYKVTGSNSYSKLVARYRQDLLAVHAASEAAQ
jgi:hypothetical protein